MRGSFPYDQEFAHLIGSLRDKVEIHGDIMGTGIRWNAMLNLDTHILVFAIRGELRPHERALLARDRWSVSGIVLWELAKLRQLGRIGLDLEDREVTGLLNRLHVWPIDLAVALISTRLDFKGDPADEIIAATSVVHRIPLVTRDRVMRGSSIVPLA